MTNESKKSVVGTLTPSAANEMFLTEEQLAARHQRSAKTLRNARVYGGYVKFVKIGRNVRYRLSDVLAFEDANLQTSTSDTNEGARRSTSKKETDDD